MRLLEPLQGIKMVAVMQPISHIAFFVSMFFVWQMASHPLKSENQMTTWEIREMQVFYYLIWGHALCILNFFVTRNLRQQKYFSISETLTLLVSLSCYLLPLFFALWCR